MSGARYQCVEITLSDGRKGTFTGGVLVESGEEHGLSIANTRFFQARKLPPGITLGTLGEAEEVKP